MIREEQNIASSGDVEATEQTFIHTQGTDNGKFILEASKVEGPSKSMTAELL